MSLENIDIAVGPPVSAAAHEDRARTRAPLSVGFLLSADQKAPVFELEPTSGPDRLSIHIQARSEEVPAETFSLDFEEVVLY
jgi:hypothetical protein